MLEMIPYYGHNVLEPMVTEAIKSTPVAAVAAPVVEPQRAARAVEHRQAAPVVELPQVAPVVAQVMVIPFQNQAF